MAETDPLHIEKIKALTLAMANVRNILPQDCYAISVSIGDKTHISISEDTLMRLYGFTPSKFGPSLTTLNTLAIFCLFESWDAFVTLNPITPPDDTTFYNDPLTDALLDTGTPTIILKTDTPDFTILNYNKVFAAATFTSKRHVTGLTWWEAFDPDQAGGAGPTLLLEGFREAIFTKRVVKMDPLPYNISSAKSGIYVNSWWDIKIHPVNYNGVVKYLLIHMLNITDKIVYQEDIEQAIIRELTMAEDLAITNAKLNNAVKNLAENNEELTDIKKQLEEANALLEKRVFERTKKLFESEASQRELIDNAPVAIGVLRGAEHILETANKKLIAYWGKDHTVVNQALAKAIPELEGQPFISILDEVRRSGVPYINPELRALLNYNGTIQPRYFDMVYHPIQYSPGITDRIFIVAVDITEHILARESLQRSESMLRLAVKAASIGTWAVTPTDKILSYDPIFAQILGWEHQDAMTYEQAVAQITDEFRESIQQAIQTAISTNGEFDFTYSQKRFNDGKVIWLRGIGKITIDDTGRHHILSGIIRQVAFDSGF